METAEMSNEHKEAMKRIAEINDLFGEVDQWAGGAADTEIKKLIEDWKILISAEEIAISEKFVKKCLKLIDRCISFREDVVEKKQNFEKSAQDKISAIKELTNGDKDIMSVLEDVIDLWNKYGQPRLELLFDKSEELETSIRDIIELVMEPIELIKENS